MNYLLTFILVPGGENCLANADALVFGPESLDSGGVFSLKQHYGNESWESYALYLGRWDQAEPIDLVILSLTNQSDANSICWPVIDMPLLKTVETLVKAIGTVKYINSMHFFVHKGNATIELVSGVSTGIQIDVMLTEGSSYYLDFTVGDERDGCEGKLIVRV
ncbi:uncharacterized protein LOC116110219 [Pistacia vera]|uniref:uncharacterized protein LOC116110219 n=1 Tax=Pistacia vera TaxID=55513 RepID=UPI0012637C58|nr:uncharacterized protein LOC116110219 [Pistacia vera]